MATALDGLRVIDLTHYIAGPFCTKLLADYGAEVIKIERPGGEDMRHYEPRFDGESAMFAVLNRGKKSLVLDLKNEAQRAELVPFFQRADILVEPSRHSIRS